MNKKEQELNIFSKFIKSKDFNYRLILMPRIYKNDNNGPDVVCGLDNKNEIGFQLVRLMSEKHYKEFGELRRLRTELENKLRNKDILYNKHIAISVNNICFTKKSINALINSILESIFQQKVKRQVYDKYTISIDDYKFENGPYVNINNFIDSNTGIIKNIENKFKKNYKYNHKLDLLAYFDFPVGDISPEMDYTKKYINDNIEKSKFTCVWIYSYIDDKILLRMNRKKAA